MKKYYAVVTPKCVGVFSNWSKARSLVTGVKNAVHQSFDSFEEAEDFVIYNLDETEICDFGLSRCELYLNKIYVPFCNFQKGKFDKIDPFIPLY